jgi:hypothetical protein
MSRKAACICGPELGETSPGSVGCKRRSMEKSSPRSDLPIDDEVFFGAIKEKILS